MKQGGFNAGLHRFALLTSVCTWVLIGAGSLVKSTESGLSVPDWPLSYGQLMPPMVGGIRFEHSHRMIAGVVLMLTLILAIRLSRSSASPTLKRLGWTAFGLVIFQALLGGLTVIYLLPPAISILHAIIAQTYFLLTVILTLVTSRFWKETELHDQQPPHPRIRFLSGALLFLFYIQLALGAAKRHGAVAHIEPHAIGALAVTLVALRLFYLISRHRIEDRVLWRTGLALCGLLGVELFLGLASWMARTSGADHIEPTSGIVLFTSAHLSVGALLLATGGVLFLLSSRNTHRKTSS